MEKKLDNLGRELPRKNRGESCLVGIQQNYYPGRIIKNLIRNIGDV